MKSQHKIFLLGFAFCCLIGASLLLQNYRPGENSGTAETIKLLMPGTYKLTLKNQWYEIWLFEQWDSVGLHKTRSKSIVYFEPDVTIKNASGTEFKLQPVPTNYINLYEPQRYSGRPAYEIEPPGGTYLVSSTTACVVAFVPRAAIGLSPTDTGNTIPSFNNDDNFLKPEKVNRVKGER